MDQETYERGNFDIQLRLRIYQSSDVSRQIPTSDKVRLGDPGWKERYYREKFNITEKSKKGEDLFEVLRKYTEGLAWVMLYYIRGCPSWNWYYPYHYAPFISDLATAIHLFKPAFVEGEAWSPLAQLLAVLPISKIGRAVQQECRDRSRMPSSA
eukprot:TRINITY_DN7909_c0_g3_i1.p1 TRINITY_DN7909_c0_g3~~TRINITY_DN7909_c0_g3_i1.p1  ORF type:complete len:181 (-),score=22.59 TRINITY_DN7909_c0_g3_i1:18-479(-)